MRAAGVPLVPGTEGAATLAEARAAARRARLPGAAEGGGGRRRQGHAARRPTRRSSTTRTRAPRPRRRRRSATATLYVEKAIAPARHVEIQVLCDDHGGVLTLRRARVLDPAPPPEADRGVAVARARRRSCARRWRPPPSAPAAHIGYRERRHVRVPVGPDGSFSFIELNARLQVEHPVTELVHRDRPRPRAAADRRRRAAARSPAARRGAGTRSSSGSTPRTRRAASRRRRARIDALPAAARRRACASTRSSRTAP